MRAGAGRKKGRYGVELTGGTGLVERGKQGRVARRAGVSWAAGTCRAERDEGIAGPVGEKKESWAPGREREEWAAERVGPRV